LYDEGNSGYNRDEVIGLKDYEIASLTDEEIAALQMMEQEFYVSRRDCSCGMEED